MIWRRASARSTAFFLALVGVGAAAATDGQAPEASEPRSAAAEPSPEPGDQVAQPSERLSELSQRFQDWLEAVEPLILGQEKRVFLDLATDYQRDAFIDRFWRVRDPHPKTARNELKVRYERRVLEAKGLYRRLDDDRSRIFMVHGLPASKIEVRCSGNYTPAEIWVYEGSEQVRFPIMLIFLVPREDDKAARLWHPELPGADNAVRTGVNCMGGEQLQLAAAAIRSNGLDWELGFRRMLAKPLPRSQEWLVTFKAFTTELPEGAETFEAAIDFEFPARYQNRTVTQGLISVPVSAAAAGDHLGFRSYNFELVGEVILNGKLFENFRYKFAFPEQEFEEARIPLAFQRYLRPGEYTLIVKLEDSNGERYFRHERQLEVPRVEGRYEPSGEVESITAQLFAEATAAVARGETSIQIVPPRSALQKGFVRFDTFTVGRDIAKVAFILDDRRMATKNRPPFNVEIDLGEFPRPHALKVEALDAEGTLLATDEIQINASSQSFDVTLLEPRRGVDYEDSLLARARVEVPEGRSLDRLEFYLNKRLMATLYQAPFTQPIALPPGEELTYVRAVAYLPDGTSSEDLVFINAPENLEEIDVQMVELYTSVLDEGGRPVLGLEAGDFEVLEDKVKQEVIKFETVENQPIHAGILFDNSASMRPMLDAARIAALTFFQDAIRPRDRVAVITFNRVPRLAVGLTSNLRLLGGGLAGLTAEGETALYDSIMYGLYYLAGIKGQRALLLLSDGKDESSRFSYEETLDYARRAGVSLYAIGLNLNDTPERLRLKTLAEETGGRAFFIDSLEYLAAIYTFIQQELRSQYLLTYQSSNRDDSDEFRTIQVKLDQKKLTARTLAGYYP